MNRTKSMTYKPTTESRELVMFAINHGELYRMKINPIIENLRKKATKGTYDTEKAIDIWYYAACTASDLYYKEFGYRFSVTDRFTAAVEMEDYYREDHVFYDLEG